MSINVGMCFAVLPKTTQDYMVVIAVTVKVCTVILLVTLVLILYYKRKLTSKQMNFRILKVFLNQYRRNAERSKNHIMNCNGQI